MDNTRVISRLITDKTRAISRQVGKFPRENTLGERSSQANGETVKVKGAPVLDNVLTTKNTVKVVPANSIGNMTGKLAAAFRQIFQNSRFYRMTFILARNWSNLKFRI